MIIEETVANRLLKINILNGLNVFKKLIISGNSNQTSKGIPGSYDRLATTIIMIEILEFSTRLLEEFHKNSADN